MARLSHLLGFVILAGLVLAACGGDSADSIPFTTEDIEPVAIPDTLVLAPAADLSDADSRMVRVHSAWLCELQGQTFTDPSEIPAALDAHLESFQVSPADYATFTGSLPGRKDLRDATLFAVQESCFGR